MIKAKNPELMVRGFSISRHSVSAGGAAKADTLAYPNSSSPKEIQNDKSMAD
jgi:hypothetical protein